MKKIKKAFTLVEMIVSVTISILLLASLSIFMWNWIKNITFQKKILEGFKENSNIYYNLNKTIAWASDYKVTSASWFIIKINRKNDKWWFAYIWEKDYNKTYCQTGNLDTKHLIIKSFIPFEYPWADFVVWTSYNEWWIIIKFFDWSVSWWWISWKFSWPTDLLQISWKTYISDTLDHTIKDENWNVIIWKYWIFWNYFEEGISATKVLLNNPTWLAFWEWKLFFSDTLNDRILYLDSGKIYSLLDESDWLNEPTGLYYDDTRKALFIANSWSWNILEYSSSWVTNNPDLEFKGFASTDKMEIEFLNSSWTGSFTNLTWPTSTGSFTFNWQDEDFLVLTWAKIIYYLEEYNSSETSQSDCNNPWDYIINSLNEFVKCTQTWTWIVWSPRTVDLDTKTITVSDISPEFPEDNYFVKVDMWWQTKYFSYFVKSDNKITTKNDNFLREVVSWLKYPTWIKISGDDLIVNTFLDRKKHTINLNTLNDITTNLTWFSNFKNLKDNKISDYISVFPIEKLEFNYSNNLLSIILKTYKQYNCINKDENIKDIEILKKVLK